MNLIIVFICVFLISKCYTFSLEYTRVSKEAVRPESPGSLTTLEFVALVSRHGSRTPSASYPNDPYPCNDTRFWPNGYGQLTNFGKQQFFQIGQILRKRYPGFLPQLYHPNDTLVEYDNIDRDFMSAACLLAALYPPVDREVWNQDLLWQPVPLRVRTFDICSSATHCPSYKAASTNMINKLDKEIKKNKKEIELLRKLSFYTGHNISTVHDLDSLHDTLVMQDENGFKLPSWTKQFYPEPLDSLVAPFILSKYAGSEFLIRLGAGPELKHISDMFNMKVNGTYKSSRKFYIETAHDCTLALIMNALGNKNTKLRLNTSSYIVFELHYLPEMYIIETRHFKNSADLEGEEVNITGCPSPCSLKNFTKFVDKLNPLNWTEICHEKPPSGTYAVI